MGIDPDNVSWDSGVDSGEIEKSTSFAVGGDASLNSVHVNGATTVTLWIIKYSK